MDTGTDGNEKVNSMTNFQKWIVLILIIFGALFLYILKTGLEFYACTTAKMAIGNYEACRKYMSGGFGSINNK